MRPHPGPQTAFLSTKADFALLGGAAGGGKSHGLLMEGPRFMDRPLMRAVYFRRTFPELTMARGLWDSSRLLYSKVTNAVKNETNHLWRFPSGGEIKFTHMQHESDRFAHQGAEYGLIGLDEATHFPESVFWYLVSRMRAPVELGVRPYMRMTCNPDPNSHLKKMILWWLDDEARFPRAEVLAAAKRGIALLRWFVRDDDTEEIYWADTPEELGEKHPHLFKRLSARERCKSFTFIPSRLEDNPSLGTDYEAGLLAIPMLERHRLRFGDWAITDGGGGTFRSEWYLAVLVPAPAAARRVRYWDLAGSKNKRSDFTAGAKASLDGETFTIEDVINVQARAGEVKDLIMRTAANDGVACEVWIEEEKGAAGQIVVAEYAKALPQFVVRGNPVGREDKYVRAKPVSSSAELGHRDGNPHRMVSAPWNGPALAQLQAFGGPARTHDDIVDAIVGAYHCLHMPAFSWASASW